MSNQILVPSLGESITEATVSKWLKQVGEKVETDEPLVELETDKVNVEVPSPLSGTLSSIKVKEGGTVEVGALLGLLEEGKFGLAEKAKTKSIDQSQQSHIPSQAAKKKHIVKETTNKNKKRVSNKQKTLTLVEEDADKNFNGALVLDTLTEENSGKANEAKYIPPKTKKNLSPAVRKIVEENKIDVSNLEGTGRGGRLAKGDLLNMMGNVPQPSKRKSTHGPEERVKMTRLRATIAKRLKQAQDSAAMLTTFNEVDMQNIMQMRENYQKDFQKKYSIKLGFMSFFVKASVVALRNYPSVNAEIEGSHIIYKNYYNISVAIGTNRGLVVPVLKKADELSFADIEKNIFTLSEKAK